MNPPPAFRHQGSRFSGGILETLTNKKAPLTGGGGSRANDLSYEGIIRQSDS